MKTISNSIKSSLFSPLCSVAGPLNGGQAALVCFGDKMGKRIDEAGNRYGEWTVLEFADVDDNGDVGWLCQCDCGIKKIVRGYALRSGSSKSCKSCARVIDIAGQRFGKWTAIELVDIKNHRARWLCQCDCGNEKITNGIDLRFGGSRSCRDCIKRRIKKKRRTKISRPRNKSTKTKTYGLRYKDLAGQRFGRLEVLKYTRIRKSRANWLCRCDCGNEVEKDGTNLRIGSTKSCGCLLKRKGYTHPNWNPEKTDEEREQGRLYSEYKAWRKLVYERDDYTCQACDARGCKIAAHHLCSFADCLDLRTDIDNGITLCKECHKKFHKVYGKGGNTLDQFLEWLEIGD